MLRLLSFLQLTFFFISNVTALIITVQSSTIVGKPSLVQWKREPSDGNGRLIFDLRFAKPDNEDIGLARANIQAPLSTSSGSVQVIFQSPMTYYLVAITGANCTKIGQSGQIVAVPVPTTATTSESSSIPTRTSTSQPVLSTTSTAPLKSESTTSLPVSTTSTVAHNKKEVGAIIGGTLGGVAFLGLLAALWIMLLRRQPQENKRWTFYREKMILPPVVDVRRYSTRRMRPRARPAAPTTYPVPTYPVPTHPAPTHPGPTRSAPTHPAPSTHWHQPPTTPSRRRHRTPRPTSTTTRRMTESSIYSQLSSSRDNNVNIKQLPRLPQGDDFLSKFPIVMMTSPSSRPRMAYPRPRPLPLRPEPLRPLPPPPPPLDHQQQQKEGSVVQMEINQMMTELASRRPMQQRVFLDDDSQGKVTWL